MTTKQMNDLVDRYLDSKGLSNPSIRKRAARKVLGYMDTTGAFLSGGQLALPSDKGVVVSAYKRHKGSALNGAEKKLLQGEFVSVGALSGEMVPDEQCWGICLRKVRWLERRTRLISNSARRTRRPFGNG